VIIIRNIFLENSERENFHRYSTKRDLPGGNVEISPLSCHAFLFLFDVKIIVEFLEMAECYIFM
jgi:hypothetical protein